MFWKKTISLTWFTFEQTTLISSDYCYLVFCAMWSLPIYFCAENSFEWAQEVNDKFPQNTMKSARFSFVEVFSEWERLSARTELCIVEIYMQSRARFSSEIQFSPHFVTLVFTQYGIEQVPEFSASSSSPSSVKFTSYLKCFSSERYNFANLKWNLYLQASTPFCSWAEC